jgi:hypothetical protein
MTGSSVGAITTSSSMVAGPAIEPLDLIERELMV